MSLRRWASTNRRRPACSRRSNRATSWSRSPSAAATDWASGSSASRAPPARAWTWSSRAGRSRGGLRPRWVRRSTWRASSPTPRSTWTRSGDRPRSRATTGSGSPRRSTRPRAARCCWPTWRPASASASSARPLERYTPATITDPAALRRQLEQVVEDGWASTLEELEAGLNAVAAPIRYQDGTVIAAVSVSGPSYRLTPARMEAAARAVAAAGREISERLGFGEPVRRVAAGK